MTTRKPKTFVSHKKATAALIRFKREEAKEARKVRGASTQNQREMIKFLQSFSRFGKDVNKPEVVINYATKVTADYYLSSLTYELRDYLKQHLGINRRTLPIVNEAGYTIANENQSAYIPSSLAILGKVNKFQPQLDDSGAVKNLIINISLNRFLYIDDIGSDKIQYRRKLSRGGREGGWSVIVNGVETPNAHPIMLGFGSHKEQREKLIQEHKILEGKVHRTTKEERRFHHLKNRSERYKKTGYSENSSRNNFTMWVERYHLSKNTEFNLEARKLDRIKDRRNEGTTYIRAVTNQSALIEKAWKHARDTVDFSKYANVLAERIFGAFIQVDKDKKKKR